MRPRLRGQRQPLLLILVACVVLFVAGQLIVTVTSAPQWLSTAAPFLMGAAPLLVEPLLARAGARAAAATTRRTTLPEATGGALPQVQTLSLTEFRVHPTTVDFPYVVRAHDQEFVHALQENRRVLAAGRSMSGKTRLAAETVRNLYPKWAIWRPLDAASILKFLAEGNTLDRTVLWLDDLERFTAAGMSTHHLESLRGSSNVIVATIRANALDSIRFPVENRLAGFDLVAWFQEPIWVKPWIESELDAALADPSATLPREAVMKHGLSGYLGGAPYLLERVRLAETMGDSAIAVIRDLVDLNRCGFTSGVESAQLAASPRVQELQEPDDQFAAALLWCCREVAPAVSIITEREGRLTLSEVILEEFDGPAAADPDEELWDYACEIAGPDELVAVGEAAESFGRLDVAERAWRKSATPLAGAYLASLMVYSGEASKLAEAERLLRLALADGIGVETLLAIVLEKIAGGEEADINEAFEMFCRAADRGDPLAAYNAGMYLIRRQYTNTEEAAEEYMRQAFDGGHRLAAGRLSAMLEARGATTESRHFLQLAAERADGNPEDQARFASQLLKEGDGIRARIYLERASERGSMNGRKLLARELIHAGGDSNLGRASRLLESIDPAFAAEDRDGIDALRGIAAIDRGLIAEGEAILRDGMAAGGRECSTQLALFLINKEVFERERARGDAGHFAIPAEVVSILTRLGRDDIEAALMLMGIYFNYGELDEAVTYSETAFAIHGDPALGAQLAAVLLARKAPGDVERARDLLRSALAEPELDPGHKIAIRNNLGLALEGLGRAAEAEPLYLEAAQAGGINAMGNLSELLRDLGGVRRRLRARHWRRRAAAASEVFQNRERHLIGATYIGTDVEPSDSPRDMSRSDELIRRLTRIRIGPLRFPSRRGLSSIWAVCARCHLPFEIPSGAYLKVLGINHAMSFLLTCTATVRPCPYCFRRGRIWQTAHPLLEVQWLDDGLLIEGNHSRTFRALMGISTNLIAGDLSIDEAIDWLRGSGTPFGLLGEEIASRALGPEDAAGLLAAVVAVVGSDCISDESGMDPDDEQLIRQAIADVMSAFTLTDKIPATVGGGVGPRTVL